MLKKLCIVLRIQSRSQLLVYTRDDDWADWNIISDVTSAGDIYEKKLGLLVLEKTNSDWPLTIPHFWNM